MTALPSVSPLAAPVLLFVAAGTLAVLPAATERPARIVAGVAGVLAALLALVAMRGGAAVGAPARLLVLLLATVMAALMLALAFAGTPAPVRAGLRARVAAGGVPAAGGCALLVPVLGDAASSLGALAALGLVCATTGATAHGAEAARDAVRRIALATVASTVGWLGLLLVAAGSTGPGALMLLLASAALGLGHARAAGRLSAPLAGAVLLLPPLAASAPLLRARAALPAGTTAAYVADAVLLGAGLCALAAGAWALRRRGRVGALALASWGPALFGWGLGTAAGLQAGFAALLFATLSGLALLAGARSASLLAAAALPPFGGFAALLLLSEAALPTRPVAGGLFLLAQGAFSLAVLRVPADGAPGWRALPVLALAASVLLGVAMPASLADLLVAAADTVSGGGF